jgi:hypothetical protein
VELARASVARARRVGNVATLVECLMLSQMAVRGPDALHERIATLREAIQLAAAAGLREQQIDATEELAWTSFELGDAREAELQMRAVVRLAEEMGRPQDRRKDTQFRVMLMYAAGRFAAADALLIAERRQSAWPPDHVDQAEAVRMVMQRFQQGRCGETIVPMESLAKQFPLPAAWHCALTNTYATVGRLNDAQRELDSLAVGDFAAIPDDHTRVNSYALLSYAAYYLRDRAAAARLRAKLAPYVDRNIMQGIHGCYGGPVSRILGMLDVVLGDYEQGEVHSDLAIARDHELGSVIGELWGRQMRVELHLARGARGDRQRAAEQLQHVEQLLRGHDLAYHVEWSARLAREIAAKSAV